MNPLRKQARLIGRLSALYYQLRDTTKQSERNSIRRKIKRIQENKLLKAFFEKEVRE